MSEKMKTVYLVTSGSYSNYGIEAAFSTRELAQKYIDATSSSDRWDAAEIEEWDLDDNAEKLIAGFKFYFGRINESGDITELEECHSRYSNNEVPGFDAANSMYSSMMAKDKEHARKILGERHAVVKAAGWPKKK